MALALLASLAVAQPAAAQQDRVVALGRDDYLALCAPCHAADGLGNGELASKLALPPSDLTGIAVRNDGSFPFWRVYSIVDGREPVAGHETFQMPQSGSRLELDEGKPGYLPAYLRVLLITHFVESLQRE